MLGLLVFMQRICRIVVSKRHRLHWFPQKNSNAKYASDILAAHWCAIRTQQTITVNCEREKTETENKILIFPIRKRIIKTLYPLLCIAWQHTATHLLQYWMNGKVVASFRWLQQHFAFELHSSAAATKPISIANDSVRRDFVAAAAELRTMQRTCHHSKLFFSYFFLLIARPILRTRI